MRYMICNMIYFLPFVDCIFTFLMVSFKAHMIIILSSPIYSSIISCAFSVISKKPLLDLRLQRFTPVFSSESFVVIAIKI